MIHTFEVRYDLDRSSAKYCISRLNYIAQTYSPLYGRVRCKSRQEIREYLKGDRKSLLFYMENLFLGLHNIKFTKFQYSGTSAEYYIRFKIEPEVFITQNYSLNLFQCNENNFDALQRHWAEMIYRFFPCVFDHRPIEGCNDLLSREENEYRIYLEDSYQRYLLNREDRKHFIRRRLYSLPYLGLATVIRCDYTTDFHCEYPEIYMKLVKKTYVDYARKKRRLYMKKRPFLAAYNKSVDGIVIYDKQKKLMKEKYNRKPNIRALIRDATNVMRVEYVWKCRNRKKQIEFTRLHLPPKGAVPYTPKPSLCGMMPYIIQDLGASRLREEYYAHIGGGQWVSDYYFKKAIRESGYTKGMKRKLMDAAYLVSQTRHLDTAEQQFVEGRLIQRKRVGELLVGGKYQSVFRGYVNRIRSLGLQPLRIPETDNWKVNGKAVTHVSSDYDNFTLVDIGVAQHPVYDLVGPDGNRFPNYDSTIADLKDLYNRYRSRRDNFPPALHL